MFVGGGGSRIVVQGQFSDFFWLFFFFSSGNEKLGTGWFVFVDGGTCSVDLS